MGTTGEIQPAVQVGITAAFVIGMFSPRASVRFGSCARRGSTGRSLKSRSMAAWDSATKNTGELQIRGWPLSPSSAGATKMSASSAQRAHVSLEQLLELRFRRDCLYCLKVQYSPQPCSAPALCLTASDSRPIAVRDPQMAMMRSQLSRRSNVPVGGAWKGKRADRHSMRDRTPAAPRATERTRLPVLPHNVWLTSRLDPQDD